MRPNGNDNSKTELQGRMGTYRGNADRVMADAEHIVARLRDTEITLRELKREYQCAFTTLYKAIHSRISKEEYRAIAYRKTIKGGVGTRFKKGHATWNKERKGIHLSPATEFKKGHIPQTYRSVGSLVVRRDKSGHDYRYIKITDEGRPQYHCVPLARYLWERAHGPIPEGGIIRHKDGDSLNDDLSNLVLINRGENARLNALIPGVRAKMKRNALKKLRKVWAKKRKAREWRKRMAASDRKKRQEAAAQDLQHKKIRDANIASLRGEKRFWYECPACGFEASRCILPCPKCGSIARFKRMRQVLELARRRAEETETSKFGRALRSASL